MLPLPAGGEGLAFGHFLFPEGDGSISPGLCGNAPPWEGSGSIRSIPEGDEYAEEPFVIYPLQGKRRFAA
ncbi:MAG: hypothetical protein DMG06_11755 [Acidobacteria bacterium]|nr:MAG: hypothetical protein DMG06_11755 [Acidobacteriota bacterium]